jgi:hypothetical protein
MLNKLRILNNYEGSAIEYIDNYILPFLPNSKRSPKFVEDLESVIVYNITNQ